MIKQNCLVSIGIPTYNRADNYLINTIESAINQTYTNLEIIIADNCSSDNTCEIVKSLSDSRIRYFRHEYNIGANENFNFCLNNAIGDYFVLLHDDDLIDEDFIETCINGLDLNRNAGIVRTGTRYIDSRGEVIKEKLNMAYSQNIEEFCLEWFRGVTSLYLCSTLFNTNKLRSIGGFKSRTNLFQDVVAQFILANKYGKVDIQEAKASFRKHSGELTFSKSVGDWCEDSLYLLDIICGLADKNKTEIREEGERFFCNLNYKRASSIKGLTSRLYTYFAVYQAFNYCVSPFHYVYWKRKHRYNRLKAESSYMRPLS